MLRLAIMLLTFAMVVPAGFVPQGTPAPTPQRITLPGDAGEALVWPGGPRAVLLAHGAVYDAASWEPQAEVMRAAGYTVLAVEDISASTIVAGIAWLRAAADATGVVVIGASAGGGGALRALADDPEGVVGLVLLGATGETAALGAYPKLFTASEGEGLTDRLEAMAAASPGDANRVEIIPGDAHAQATFRTPQGDRLLQSILAFLDADVVWQDGAATPEASAAARDADATG